MYTKIHSARKRLLFIMHLPNRRGFQWKFIETHLTENHTESFSVLRRFDAARDSVDFYVKTEVSQRITHKRYTRP